MKKLTTAWNDAEALIVNGIRCCYTIIERQGYLVHLPGGTKKYAHDLIFEGYEIVLPDKVRGEDNEPE